MEPITKAADHLAGHDGYYLFIVALIVMGIFAWMVLKYLVQQNKRLMNDHAAERNQLIADHAATRKTYEESLQRIVYTYQEQLTRFAVLLTRNIVALEDNTRHLAEDAKRKPAT